MPELPEVETVRRGLEPVLAGATIARVVQRRPDLRFPLPERFVERLQGRRIETLTRRAKYILGALDLGEVLAIHLGMTGRFTIAVPGGANGRQLGEFAHEAGTDSVHDHVVIETQGGRERDVQRRAPIRIHEPRPRGRNGNSSAFPQSRHRAARTGADAGVPGAPGEGPKGGSEGLFDGPTNHRRAWQHLRLRGAAPGGPQPQTSGFGARQSQSQGCSQDDVAGGRHTAGSGRGDCGRRFDAARLSPHRRLARIFPARICRLWPGRRDVPAGGMRRHRAAQRAGGALDVPLLRTARR